MAILDENCRALHTLAMETADQMNKSNNPTEKHTQAMRAFTQATAAWSLVSEDSQPTHAVLGKFAAWLAIDAGVPQKALAIVHACMPHCTSDEIRLELEDVRRKAMAMLDETKS